MANPIRLDETLLSAAEKAGAIQKRSVPKQVEFWAELGKTVEHAVSLEDIFAVIQGVKKIVVEPVDSVPVTPDTVFDDLEDHRKKNVLSKSVTTSAVYYESSKTVSGMLDRVDLKTGERRTGMFRNGEFIPT